jgi:hypothetical protein
MSEKINIFREVVQQAQNNYKSHNFDSGKVCIKCGYDLSSQSEDYFKPVKSCDEIYYIKDILE